MGIAQVLEKSDCGIIFTGESDGDGLYKANKVTDNLLSMRGSHSPNTEVAVGKVVIGGRRLAIIAGPCTVSDRSELFETASAVVRAGARVLRGGVYKTRTSPHDFQGLGQSGLSLLAEASRQFSTPCVTEVVDPRDIDLLCNNVDMIQIGSRNMQNVALLKEVGKTKHPVLLKRGFANTVYEFLAAADYILAEGNPNVVLCERGIRSFENSTRFSLDILAIPVIKRLSHLPLIVDPSHACGDRHLVIWASRAAIAAGADGLIIEVSSAPDRTAVDAKQTISIAQFTQLMVEVNKVSAAVDREL